jgi:hypothetical protein
MRPKKKNGNSRKYGYTEQNAYQFTEVAAAPDVGHDTFED